MLALIDGYKRYTILVGIIINNLLKFMGFAESPTAQEITDAVNVILAVVVMILTYTGKKKTQTP